MPVFISMGLVILLFSLYPLVASIGLQTMSSLDMILIVYFFSGFGSILVGFFYLWKKKLLKQVINIQKELSFSAYIPAFVCGVSGVLSHAFFIISLSLANKAGVSLLYESWPIIAVIATPMLMKKAWKEVSLKEVLMSLIALIGVAIIILTDANIDFKGSSVDGLNNADNDDYSVLGGYILAFAAAYMTAVLVVTRGTYSENFKSLDDDIASSLVSEIFGRTISMFFMSLAFVYLKDDFYMADVNWAATFFIGFVVFVVGGVLYTYSLLKTDRPTIHIMYYFVPVLAVIWLWVFDESTINSGLLVGGAIILAANIYLVIAGRKAEFEEEPSSGL